MASTTHSFDPGDNVYFIDINEEKQWVVSEQSSIGAVNIWKDSENQVTNYWFTTEKIHCQEADVFSTAEAAQTECNIRNG